MYILGPLGTWSSVQGLAPVSAMLCKPQLGGGLYPVYLTYL
jgi:hypothetical protein